MLLPTANAPRRIATASATSPIWETRRSRTTRQSTIPVENRHGIGSASQTSGMRLNAWLARAGVASRRGADELIKAGRVTVNGELGQLNTFVAARDRVELDGRRL